MPSPFQQLALPLRFNQSASFDNFYSIDQFESHTLISHLTCITEPLIMIRGLKSSGKSHLLNASALLCQSEKMTFQYFSAKMLIDYEPDVIAPCDSGDVVIIDDIHLLINNQSWERKLYDLYNDAQRHQWLLVLSCLSDRFEQFALQDWLSRMKSCVQISLTTAENELAKIIRLRAKSLGLKIKPEVVDYLLNHYPRDMANQLDIMSRLDEHSLEKNRHITIPFIKQVLATP